VSGDTAVVVAPASGPSGESAGWAYAYVRSNGAWTMQAQLGPCGQGDVAVSGDTAVVGLDGLARVYVRSGATWTLQAELSPGPEGRWDDQFGRAVAVSGDTAVVGAPHWGPDVDHHCGAVYVFKRSGAAWSTETQLTASDATSGDDFGADVALEGDRIVVGASNHALLGAAYVFSRNGSTWTQQTELAADDGVLYDGFGASVAISGPLVVVGAPGGAPSSNECGAAYTFQHSPTEWRQQAKLVAGDPEVWSGFGGAVAVSDGLVVVGARAHNIGRASDAGAAYAYWSTGQTWSLPVRLSAPDAAGDDWFGDVVAISGSTVVTASAHHASAPGQSGEVFVYTLTRPPAPRVTRLSLTKARRLRVISILGSAFGDVPDSSYVKFGSTRVSAIRSWSPTSITCKVPIGVRPGRVKVRVVTAGGVSNGSLFTVTR